MAPPPQCLARPLHWLVRALQLLLCPDPAGMLHEGLLHRFGHVWLAKVTWSTQHQRCVLDHQWHGHVPLLAIMVQRTRRMLNPCNFIRPGTGTRSKKGGIASARSPARLCRCLDVDGIRMTSKSDTIHVHSTCLDGQVLPMQPRFHAKRGEWHQLGLPHSDSAAFPGRSSRVSCGQRKTFA